MARKDSFAQATQGAATELVRAIQRVETVARIYVSEGYAEGAADEMAQADLDGTAQAELDVADVHVMLNTMIPTLTTWLDTSDRRAVLDRLIEVISL
jgi:hypothetical protein